MEKQEAKSKWDELARELGAEVSPETEQLVETGPPPPADPVSSTVRTKSEADEESHLSSPKRPAAGWDNLANEFGLPVPEQPEPIVDEVVPVSKHAAEPRGVDDDRPRHDRSSSDRRERYDKRRETSRRGHESSERGRESSGRPRQSSARGRESSEGGRETAERRRDSSSRSGERPHKRRDSRDRRDTVESGEGGQESAEAPGLDRDAPPAVQREREEQKPERAEQSSMLGPAVSLWHKIFGSPADQSAKIEEISSRDEEQEASSDAHDEQSMISDVAFDRDRAVEDTVESPARDELEESLEPDSDSERAERDERRPRRPRRRRRGRGGTGEPTSDGPSRVRRKPHRADDIEAKGELDQGADDDDDNDLDLSTGDEDDIVEMMIAPKLEHRARREAVQHSSAVFLHGMKPLVLSST